MSDSDSNIFDDLELPESITTIDGQVIDLSGICWQCLTTRDEDGICPHCDIKALRDEWQTAYKEENQIS